ncbi:MAG: alanyl-tRNA editing protein [Pseudobutyrivibrio sp.]|nr:alanyl-tRNA editing protein [Pseudobutyrivibrio sp.]
MTEKLYDLKPYDKEFDAKVISCSSVMVNDESLSDVVLDRTLFFPEQGGQTPDKGYLGTTVVVDVQVDKDEVVHHYCRGNINTETVHGIIDWEHRYNNMQQHSGEHVFTGLAHNIYGAENVGFHLSDNVVTLDLDVDLTEEQVADLENRANEVVYSNVAIYCYYPSDEELDNIEYRSKKEIAGAVRIVEIEGIDMCACCAPHVARTGEIGIIKVMSAIKYKGGVRVSFLCGRRALMDYRQKMAVIEKCYQPLSCMLEELPDKVTGLLNANKQLKYDLMNLKAQLLDTQIALVKPEEKDVIIFSSNLDVKVMRDAVNGLVEGHPGICAVFSGDDEMGYSFILGSQTVDCKEIADMLRNNHGGKCGGSGTMIQGSVIIEKDVLLTSLLSCQ